jgi:hypothetical protein
VLRFRRSMTALKARASKAGQMGKARKPPYSAVLTLFVEVGLGHQDQFPRPKANGRYGFRKRPLAG